ncbi:putative HD superfamily hydrolase of NAD metabolism [Amphibacillus marinus]|uniref:bis(5'-nucleosyl)-tetraphosphatase (symmetrical) n=1 Tax=Amphibacillus marinus TaxID=872970 RepID=A0A1H8NTG4_9BACI|nr:bis(5'-nucleosyl)-tetraphosphatase (symmetrical) YqeK [Amphibacillus marinus]SEO32887.1 putative HD superfamily hydrolase of NAD metabolism [Amphibacillus marinus]
MNKASALARVKPQLNASRYAHTERVTDVAIALADRFDVDQEQAMLAAVFHDYAKYRDLTEMEEIIRTFRLPIDLLSYHHELWHGPVASVLLENELGIVDEAIKNAVFWHTTGHAHMSMLEKVIYLADYIEPGRNFTGIDHVRKKAETSLNEACFMAVRNSIKFLIEHERLIYPETLNMYNDLKRKLEETYS